MKINLKNVEVWNTLSHGVNIDPTSISEFNVDGFAARNVGGSGIHIAGPQTASPQTLFEALHLPPNTNIRELAQLLNSLGQIRPTQQAEEVSKSRFFTSMKSYVTDASALVTSIVTLANTPGIKELIQKFL